MTYYVLNVQGDVMGLVDGDGNLLICYLYEGFGEGYYTADTSNQTAALASTNPLGYRGYVLDIGTAMYYLQSRYYDPTLGRFLNADGLVSTGQGLSGNNMFAYCLNNPVEFVDSSGMIPLLDRGISVKESVQLFGVGLGIVGVTLIAAAAGGKVFADTISTFISDVAEATKEVYAYSQMLRQEIKETVKSRPQVHHIVPVGYFFNRSPEIREKVFKLHEVLHNAKINRFLSPLNLLLVSAKTHSKLHTDAYIEHVYDVIMATNGSRKEIRAALFELRLEIAGWDKAAVGY